MRILFWRGRDWVLLLAAGMLFLGLQAHAQRGRKYKPPPPTATINVTVLRGTNGKPIPNAAVIFHPYKDGKDTGALELKSNEDGKAKIDIIPIGDVVRLQIIADGWQTFGNDYNVDAASKDIVVKMKRPSAQRSSFADSGSQSDLDPSAPQGQSNSAKPNDQTPLPQ